jgi:hypothetical protein
MMAALALRRLLRALVAGNPAARARMVEVMERPLRGRARPTGRDALVDCEFPRQTSA